MAVNIGPRIGIDGEAEYRKSINAIIEQQKTLKSEYKAVASELDKETSAIKKNKQQKEILNKQIETQNKRVEELNKMLEESSAKYGENDSKTLKWKQAVADATTELNGFKTQLDELPSTLDIIGQKLEETGKSVKETGDKMSKFGEGVTKAVTGPIVAVGAASVAAFNEVDGAEDILIKKTGATGDALKDLSDVTNSIATTIPTGFDTAATAVGEVNTRFGLAGKELERISTQFIKFADINDTDVNSAVDSVSSAMSAFNISGDQAGAVLNMLNKAGQNTGTDLSKLAGDLTSNSVALQEMGFNLNSSIGLLSNLEKNGLDTSVVIAGMRKALQNAAKDGKPMSEALAELETAMAGAETDTQAMALAMEVFGDKAGPTLAMAIQEGSLSFDAAKNSVEDYAGSVTGTFEATLDPLDQSQMAMNGLKLIGADLASTGMELLVPMLEKLTEILGSVKTWFDGLDDSEKENIVQIGAIVAAVGPAIMIVGKVISIGGTLISVLGTIVSAINPVTLAIGAVVAAGVLVYQNWDTIVSKGMEFKDNIRRIWEIVKKKFEDAIDYIKGLFDFEWSFPKIELPHFSIVGEFSLNPPKVPTLGVEWYAKAMDRGMILTNPTIFGASNGHLLGAGDAGPEVVVGASSLVDMIRSAVGSTTYNNGGNNVYVYGAPGQDVAELAREIADIINADVHSKGAVWA